MQANGGGKVGGLAEIDKILKGEGQSDGLGKLDRNILVGLVDVGVCANGNSTVTNVTGAGELDTLLASLNNN